MLLVVILQTIHFMCKPFHQKNIEWNICAFLTDFESTNKTFEAAQTSVPRTVAPFSSPTATPIKDEILSLVTPGTIATREGKNGL